MIVACVVLLLQELLYVIDHFKVNAAMSPGVQTYWDERAAKY